MRHSIGRLSLVLLLTGATSAGAQITMTPQAPAPAVASGLPTIGEVQFGGRASSISGDAARYQRYRDLRDGPTLDQLRYDRVRETWEFRARFNHVGYRDQQYRANFTQYGKVKASFEWDQVPFFYSMDTTTPFTSPSLGVFRLNDAYQAAIQAGLATRPVFAPDLRQFDLRSQRNTADARLSYRATPALDLRFSFKSTEGSGAQPWGAGFGQSNAVVIPAPIDRRTNDLNTTAEWSNDRGMARLAYDGSWFNNRVESVIFDNPLAVADRSGLPSQGRMAPSPDSTAHTVSGAGSVALPGRTRAFGYLSVGSWLQDAALLPFTINTALPTLPLSRPAAEADARIVAMNYRVTSRPTPSLWLNGQFKSYDYDNRTPRFVEAQYVGLDSNIVTSATGGSEPFGQVRRFVDLDASYAPLRFTAFRVGYGHEHTDRTFRYVEETTEHTMRAAVDSTGLSWGSMRLQYEFSDRTGKGLDEEVLSDVGEQTSLRQFDISDRRRNRLVALVQVAPVSSVGFNASAGIGRDHRPSVTFGLQDNDTHTYTLGVDASRGEVFIVGTEYTFENYSTLQRSRQANPGPEFDDPTRDWSTDMNEDVHTLTTSLDLLKIAPRTTARVAYDYVNANARYLYLLPPNTTLATPKQLAPVTNEIQRATVDVRYSLSERLGIGGGYWYESYDVQDFARSPGTIDSSFFPALINLMYLNRPYQAHTFNVRLIYTW